MASALPVSSAADSTSSSVTRVIALIDMDCFEVQIWQRMYPEFDNWGRPCIVADKGGRIVSVSYEAREYGINRDMRVKEAKKKAAGRDFHIFEKPNDREKPDGKMTRYAGYEILDAVIEYVSKNANGVIFEYSSSDEFFLDITSEIELRVGAPPDVFLTQFESQTYLEGEHEKLHGESLKKRSAELHQCQYSGGDSKILDEKKLVYGGLLMQDILNHVFFKTKFTGSAGIGTNKLMAKLAVSLNKPNGITILPHTGLPRISQDLTIEKIVGLGGKFGAEIKRQYGITTVKQLLDIGFDDLLEQFPDRQDRAIDAFLKCNGVCEEPVREKLHPYDVSCAKSFFGQITSDELLMYHLYNLAEEMVERLEEERIRHKRKPTTIRANLVFAKKSDPKETINWSHIFGNPNQTASLLTDAAMKKIIKDVKDPIDSLAISKIGLQAKGFVNLTN